MNQQMRMKAAEMEKKKGKWVIGDNLIYHCSACGKEPKYDDITEYKFCPYCGLMMVLKEDFLLDPFGRLVPDSICNSEM